MARPGLLHHRKFRLLHHLLAEPEPHVLGYLEMLWNVGYVDGNPLLGDSDAVEAAAKYPGPAGQLTTALLRAGFLDQLPGGDYQIHDLLANAPGYVKGRARAAAWRARQRDGSVSVAQRSVTEAHESEPVHPLPTPSPKNKKKVPKKELSAAPADGPAASQPGEEPQPEPKKGTPNPIWDALCLAFGLKPVTKAECKRVGRIVADLKAKAARPEDIALRLERYRHAWPDVAATPEALLKHWDAFAAAGGPALESAQERDARILRQRAAAQAQREGAARGVSLSELSELFKEEPDA